MNPTKPARCPLLRPAEYRSDGGSGTLLMVGAVLTGIAVLCGVLLCGTVVVAQHRLRSAADLAAIAGAQHWKSAPDEKGACKAAKVASEANSAKLKSCRAEGDPLDFVVAVEVTTPILPGVPGIPQGRNLTETAYAGVLSEP